MARRPPSRSGLLITTGLVFASVVWTILVARDGTLPSLDRQLVAPTVTPLSPFGQVLSAIALLTWPYVVYSALLVVAIWAARRRLRNLAVSLVVATVLAGGSAWVLRRLIGRDRPAQMVESIAANSFSFPSGHVTAAITACVMVGAVLTVTRQSKLTRRWYSIGAVLLLIVVVIDRWAMSAHWVSDIIGGLLLGGACSAFALVAADVHVLPKQWEDLVWTPDAAVVRAPGAPRCAVIYNPAKVTDWVTFRRHVEFELERRGYRRTLWLETTVDDPGRAQARQAIDEGVDLVLGAGGDGTVRVVTSELAGTRIPFGLVPAGTGNLLAKNLAIPLDETEALVVALDGRTSTIDLVKITVTDGDGQRTVDHFAVMAGIGIDAAILGHTDAQLKKAVGSAAYFVSAAQHVNHPPMKARITVDDGTPFRRTALVMVVGNVGYLQAGIPLIPDARPDDGLLDLLVASPRTWRDKVAVTAQVLTRHDRSAKLLDRITARKVQITIEEPEEYQLDGDSSGTCRKVTFEVAPGALTMRLPRQPELEAGQA